MRNVRFGFNILFKPQDTAFPAKAGLFEAAERSKRIMCYTINQYSASLDSGADTLCPIHIRRADIRIQPIFGIIGHLVCRLLLEKKKRPPASPSENVASYNTTRPRPHAPPPPL